MKTKIFCDSADFDVIKKYNNLDIFVIGGPNILNQLFTLIETFYLTRIYGNFSCDNNINLSIIEIRYPKFLHSNRVFLVNSEEFFL